MADWDWTRFIITAALTVAAIQYGKWLQRREDRKAAEKRAVATAQAILRRDGRGA